ncbi:MAG: 50S ribosomal protein L4 [Patescibacteria group bacterium]|nr:50S ribosomal protein L4 [Patescibacteria group bacterium]
MKFDLYNQKGKKLDRKVDLDDTVFVSNINRDLMNLAVYVYLSNQRQSNANTQTRGEARGGGAKPWKQKGTGRARHGSIRSPIWKGGGVAFGPRNNKVYKKTLNKKMKKAAIRSSFSLFAKKKVLTVLDSVEINGAKLTQQVSEMNSKLARGKKVLYIHNGENRNLYLGSRNLRNVGVIPVNEANTYTLLSYDHLVILENVLDTISKLWAHAQVSEKGKPREDEKANLVKTRKKIVSKEKTLSEIGLTTRIATVLEKQGIKSPKELQERLESGKKIDGIGAKSVEEIQKVLKIK